MKKLILISLLSISLISCGTNNVDVSSGTGSSNLVGSGTLNGTGSENKDFYIDTKSINSYTNETFIEKSGKITSTQDISVSSQVNGRVSAIYKKEGESVKIGQPIVIISDNIANYGLQLSSAKNNLEKAKLNYETTKLSLDKSIIDIERNIKNSQIDNDGSQSALELEKIENSIKKLGIDYDNLKISNQEQIKSFKNLFNSNVTTFTVYIEDIIDFSNDILGVDVSSKDDDIAFDRYIGGKDNVQLNKAKDLLRELIIYNDNQLNNINFLFDNDYNFENNVQIIIDGFSLVDNFLSELDDVFDNSITSIGVLSQQQLDGFKSQVSLFNNTYNQINGSFVSLQNNLNSFLETYQNSEDSLLKQIGLLEQDKRIFIKSLDVQLEGINATLEEAKKNRELTLKNLDLIITDAEIGYSQALNQYNKLTITSPINGVVSEIGVDVGQEITLGTPVISVLNNSDNLVQISFTKEELSKVNVGDKVEVDYLNQKFAGIISSISQTADRNLKYKSEITLIDDVNLLGSIVTVRIPIQTSNKLIPINIVEIGSNGSGQVNIYKDGEIKKFEIQVGKIFDDMIEIIGTYDDEVLIISNYIDNFDKNKFNLKLRDINE